MLRAPAKVIAAAAAAVAISGATITVAYARPAMPGLRHGSERITIMATVAKTSEASIIATGVFTDGGTINIGVRGRSAEMKLGGGTIRLTTTGGSGRGAEINHKTCLTTLTASGTYRLSDGTGKYAGIRGSGHFSTAARSVSPRKRDGSCALSRELAYQAVVTLTGPATLRR